MGIIRAAVQSVRGTLADQWKEVVEPDDMGEQTVFTKGVVMKNSGGRASKDVISNGSVIHVYDNQFMLLVDFRNFLMHAGTESESGVMEVLDLWLPVCFESFIRKVRSL